MTTWDRDRGLVNTVWQCTEACCCLEVVRSFGHPAIAARHHADPSS